MTFSDYWGVASGFIQVTTGEGELLYQTAKLLPPHSLIVEIGTLKGGTAYLLGKSRRRVYTIDNYSESGSNIGEATANLKSLRNVHLLVGTSEEIAKTWKQPIDLLFVDGSHLYEMVILDLNSWLPLVKQGGFVVFHDFMSHWGTTVAVSEAVGARLLKKIKIEGSMLVCQKL